MTGITIEREETSKPKNTHRQEGIPVLIPPQDTSWTGLLHGLL